jgi:hypothetical protein
MVEYFKDEDDRLLESLLASEPLADDGFSYRIVRRIRRRLWGRRLALATAVVIGGAIAVQPAVELSQVVVRVLQNIPGGVPGIELDAVPSMAMLAGGGVLFLLTVVGARLLED